MRHRRTSKGDAWLAALFVVLATLSAPHSARADDPEPAVAVAEAGTGERIANAGAAALDVVVLRPLGALATAGGFGAFLITAPFLFASGEHTSAWDVFVAGPADYTFGRPIGDF